MPEEKDGGSLIKYHILIEIEQSVSNLHSTVMTPHFHVRLSIERQ